VGQPGGIMKYEVVALLAGMSVGLHAYAGPEKIKF
jgi:hypothetical protein